MSRVAFLRPFRAPLVRKHPVASFGPFRNFSSDPSYLGDALSTDGSIETVPLAYDTHLADSEAGSKKSPILILHGLFGSKTNSRTVAKELASKLDRNVFCLDLRNFGQSPHNQRLDYPALSADVERFIIESDFAQKPILIGHSMGAKTIMALALRQPDLPKMLIPVDNAPVDLSSSSGSNSGFIKYVNQLRLSLEKYKYTNIKDVDAQLAKVEPSLPVRQFLLTNLNRGKKNDVITSKIPLDIVGEAIVKGKISSWPFDSNVSRWSQGPVMFIRGTESNYVPDEIIPEIGKYFPDFEIRDVKSGHWVISEKPKEFVDLVVEFVERKEDEL
ncbi:alpha/beta-hydrolase [Suhomyces tanzawaensis NRRL Y-17324]|uniref:Alpha/beta-hydrolase n=1 Tax=Suhomyces tanzawaensis NRRL Y-17324 TaxID=984487 RepID=A0A1E4SLK6_9ASCO|nr:alpha/beta-hydrolase [Suhomyces tanzawaensis NRRL Y-17324]ODV80406.1 alpha/beta-hydrolase [Suhomyces tanzawaensis NRRL Y-17324]